MKDRIVFLICDCGKKIECCISSEYENKDKLTCNICNSIWEVKLRKKA